MLGNILLAFCVLFLYGLINITSQPMPGGDRGVGYAFTMMLTAVGFALFSGLLFWHLNAKGNFLWLTVPFKGMWIFLGWLAFALAVSFLAFFRAEWHPGEFPEFLHSLTKIMGDIILPAMVLIPAFLMLNTYSVAGTIPWYSKFLFIPGIGISVFISLTLLFGFMRISAQTNAIIAKEKVNFEQKIHKDYLEAIQNYKVGDPVINLLSLTGRFHDDIVREGAVEKIKQDPNWENELIRLLEDTEWQSGVYSFIDGNTVDHPEKFVGPLKKSLARTAASIRENIKDSNNLQDWHFEHFGLERCLRAIDEQFSKVPGADFVPEVEAVLSALRSPKPERFKNVQFTTEKILENWLKKHKK